MGRGQKSSDDPYQKMPEFSNNKNCGWPYGKEIVLSPLRTLWEHTVQHYWFFSSNFFQTISSWNNFSYHIRFWKPLNAILSDCFKRRVLGIKLGYKWCGHFIFWHIFVNIQKWRYWFSNGQILPSWFFYEPWALSTLKLKKKNN